VIGAKELFLRLQLLAQRFEFVAEDVYWTWHAFDGHDLRG
jgi:hypothetical protein